MRTVVYTAEIDDRFGSGKVSSRIGLSSPARLYNTQTALFTDIADEHKRQPIHCVLVDESQFLTREQVRELSEVVDQLDIPVLCYGLRTDFRGELFTGSQYLPLFKGGPVFPYPAGTVQRWREAGFLPWSLSRAKIGRASCRERV